MYDPFRYADNFTSEEEYINELEEEENDKKPFSFLINVC